MTKTSKSKAATAPNYSKAKATNSGVTVPPATSDGDNQSATAPAESPGASATASPKAPSKQDQLAALVVRDEGATLDEMVAALGWLPHTTRAALTGLKKKGFSISSDKVGGVRTYRAFAPE